MSAIRLDRDTQLQKARFAKGDIVQMSVIEDGQRAKKTFQVHGIIFNRGGWIEYQLKDIMSGQLYRHGAGVRERDLKVEHLTSFDTSSDAWGSFSKKDKKKSQKTTMDEPDFFSQRPKEVRHELESPGEEDRWHETDALFPSSDTLHIQDTFDSENVPLIIPELAKSAAEVQSFVDSGYASEGKKTSKLDGLVPQVEGSVSMEDDAASIYSDQSSVASSFKDMYIAEMAADVLEHVPAGVLSNEDGSMERLYERLPRLLKGFAIDLADASRTQESRDTMVFISKHRHAIVSQLRRLCEGEVARDRSADWTIEEKISHWQSAVSSNEHDTKEAFVGVADLPEAVDETDEVEPSIIPRYRDLVITSQAHAWLVGRVEHELVTTRLEPSGIRPIGETIMSHLSSSKSLQVISRSRNPGHCDAKFLMSWDPVGFFDSQGCDVEYAVFMQQAIALTGRDNDAQATTVSQYLHQCWPRVAEALLKVLKRSGTTASRGKEATSLNLGYHQAGDEATISVTGNAEAIAEVGEAASWLSATLRSSGRGRLSSCYPNAVLKQQDANTFAWDITYPMFDLPVSDSRNAPQGTCWRGLFQDPILVQGFPILKKPTEVLGLEIPLNIMTALIGSRRITNFSGNLFIKGFSTALVLTKRSKHVCTWHLLFNEDGDHISYDDPRVRSLAPVQTDATSIHKLESARHIVGWCSNIRSLTGSPEASYDIRLTKLPRPKPGFALEKVSISGGKFVSAGLSFSVGKKDKPLHVKAREDYIMQLKWILKKYVVLYDVEDRRAWLVDGVSALLHLVRASLKHEQSDDFSDSFLFRPEQLREADESRVGRHAAIFVLTQAMNQNLPLHKNADDEIEETTIERGGESSTSTTSAKIKSTHYRLRNRVEEIYHLLEQIITYQSQASSEDGVAFKVRASPRERLEGFDFMDVATDEDPFWPRVTTLRSTGNGWVDFVREIQAITLFGKGFGELLKPTDDSGSCQWWKEVPTGEDHLVASVSDLNDILDKWGDKTPHSWQLVEKVHWHSPDKLFETCQCERNVTQKPCDRIQVLLPASSLRVLTKKSRSPTALEERGAVIFGHSRTLPLKWNERGEVKEGPTEDLVESLRDHDLESEASSTRISDNNVTLISTPAASGLESSQTLPSSNGDLASDSNKRTKKESQFLKKLRYW